MPDEERVAEPAAAPKSKKLITGLILLAIMVAEGGLIFAAMKMFGASPATTAAWRSGRRRRRGVLPGR